MLRKSMVAVLGGVALLATLLPALAQVNTVPQVGVQSGYVGKTTYSSAFFGLVPVVTSGTDQICISGSATKTVKVQRITINGTTATAPQTVPLTLVRRASLDTGGTAAGTTANPGITTQISRRDLGSPAATAVLVSYTAAPTIVDAAPTYIDSQLLSMPIVTSVMPYVAADFNFARDIENLLQPPTLVGLTAQLCVNNSAALTNASAWNGSIVWTEE